MLLLVTLPVFLVSFVLCLVSFDRAPRGQVATLGLVATISLALLVVGAVGGAR
ncbi:MAG: hypothetical protein IPH44_28960 [Myxococcales bacterium]|nr:hypothetical protein [Myxococcales bacterium]MBK7191355.1 hypothetical protein [Myxococcales bacterium]MBP6848675.1 hypothetical protein [Kofleriaceae bacterium]